MMQEPKGIRHDEIFDWKKEGIFPGSQDSFSVNENTPQLPGKIGGVALMLSGSSLILVGIETLSGVETAGDVAATFIITYLGVALARAGIDTPFWSDHIAKSAVQIGKQVNEDP